MSEHKVHVDFPGRILLVGFGSIGQGVLPLILRHIGIAPQRVTIVAAEELGRAYLGKYLVAVTVLVGLVGTFSGLMEALRGVFGLRPRNSARPVG